MEFIKKFSALTLAVILTGTFQVGIALADDISNHIDLTVDSTLEVMNLTVGGGNVATTYTVRATNGDGKNGCNFGGPTHPTLVVSVNSSNPAAATVSPSQITFSGCGDTPTVTVTPVGAGSSNITLSELAENTAGTFSLSPASFTAVVTDPAPTDSTGPEIVATVTPTENANGWHNSDVTVNWTVTDAESAGPDKPNHDFPEDVRDKVVGTYSVHVDDDQTFRYRNASGDHNPIHVDDEIARSVGLPGKILHGLCTMAMTSQAVIRTVAGGDPAKLKRIAVRFAANVLPGNDVETTIYDAGERDGRHCYAFEATSAGATVIKNGWAEVDA